MNNKLSVLRAISLTQTTILLLSALSPALAVDPALPAPALTPAPAPLNLWAAGDADSVYLILAHQTNDTTGFRVFSRSAVAPRFIPGRRYSGTPATVTMFDRRCHIFFSGGYHQSYDLHDTRTERKLPDHLAPLACSASSANLYVLARLDQPTTFDQPAKPDQPITLDQATASDPPLTLSAGQHVIMVAPPANRGATSPANRCPSPIGNNPP